MIRGRFGEDYKLIFELELLTNNDLELSIEAWFDTGFSGWLAMNSQDIEELGWNYLQEQPMQTTKGIETFELYAGRIKLDSQEFYIPVHVGDEVTEFLLGRQWLQDCQLWVNLPLNILNLGQFSGFNPSE